MTSRSFVPVLDGGDTRLAALARLTARIAACQDQEGVLDAIAAGVVEELSVALVRIWLHDPSDDVLRLRAEVGATGDRSGVLRTLSLRDTAAPVVQAVARHEAVVLDEIDADGGFDDPDQLRREGLRASAAFPLTVGDRTVGAIVAFLRTAWPPDLLAALGALAPQAALALEHARLRDEAHTFQRIAADLASAHDTSRFLEGLVQRVMAVQGADACAVWMLDEDGHLQESASRGISQEFYQRLLATPGRQRGGLFDKVARTGRPLFTRDDIAAAREHDPDLADALAAEGIVSALRLPLFGPGGRVAGMLALYHRRERIYGENEIRLAQAFTDQIAVALHNARLAEKERAARAAATRQIDRLHTLARITEQLLRTDEPDTILHVVVESSIRLSDAAMAVVALVDPEEQRLTAFAAAGPIQALLAERKSSVPLDGAALRGTIIGRAYASGGTVMAEDYAAWPVVTEAQEVFLAAGARATIATPLGTGGKTVGMLCVADTRPRRFTPDDIALIEALANQAALAIEHTRLARRGREAAVLEERARLARDLHDSVTQSVFSLGMLAQAAQMQHQRGSDALGETLTRIGGLARDALAEMRALLFELRPSTLVEEGLAAALEKLVDAFRVRLDAPIVFETEGDTSVRLAADMEMAIFRIVQESLANTVKHARAGFVRVALIVTDDRLTVTVQDDGVGFDMTAPGAASTDDRQGGMGMRSMRERAVAVGLALHVTSAPNAGTSVTVAAALSGRA